MESWLIEKITEAFTVKENEIFIVGDGEGKPRRIIIYEDGENYDKINQVKNDVLI